MAIYGIGNPLIDFLCFADETDLEKLSLHKGTMLLIDEEKRAEILQCMANRKKTISCGDSCPNTMVTLRMLGAETILAGGVGDDEYGEMYRQRLIENGVKDETITFKAATGTSIILLTDDRERTMNTFLGANRLFDECNVNEESARNADLFYFTGYMWDTDEQRRAVRKVLRIAKENNVKVAFDLADPFAVGRYRADFLDLVQNFILFDNNIRMRRHKVFVIERDMTDDAQTIGDNTELEDVAKMSIDIQLLDFRIRRSMGGHGSVGSLIRIVGFIKALSSSKRLKLLNDSISVLRIVFGDKCFNTGRIKDGHIRFCRINGLADGLCNINEIIEYELQII